MSLDLDLPRYQVEGGARVAGDPVAGDFLTRVAELVPEHRYAIETRSEDAALALLTFGGAVLSVLTRPCTRDELVPYRKIVRQDPVLVPVARATPWEIYVHADNPLPSLAPDDLPRIFGTGDPRGDIRSWSQLGVTGPSATRRIETMACPRHRHFLTDGVKGDLLIEIAQPHDHLDDRTAAAALARDPTGLMVATAGLDEPGIRPLGLAPALTRHLYFVLRRPTTGQIDPLATALTEAALSEAGQSLTTKAGLNPLNPLNPPPNLP